MTWREARVQNALDDVARNMWQALGTGRKDFDLDLLLEHANCAARLVGRGAGRGAGAHTATMPTWSASLALVATCGLFVLIKAPESRGIPD